MKSELPVQEQTYSFDVQGVLLDIEGTTSSISFVYDVMFPYVREQLASFVDQHWGDESFSEVVTAIRSDLESIGTEKSSIENGPELCEAVIALMDADHKTTGLKKLQGMIWKRGFESGQLVSHVYDDVLPAIDRWRDAGVDVRIYSSGSIQAQKLFFGHTANGDLLDRFSNHYDTTTGSKKEPASYQKIVTDFGLPAGKILFVSDVPAELEAAQNAGLQTILSLRPGNPRHDNAKQFDSITSFEQISVELH